MMMMDFHVFFSAKENVAISRFFKTNALTYSKFTFEQQMLNKQLKMVYKVLIVNHFSLFCSCLHKLNTAKEIEHREGLSMG